MYIKMWTKVLRWNLCIDDIGVLGDAGAINAKGISKALGEKTVSCEPPKKGLRSRLTFQCRTQEMYVISSTPQTHLKQSPMPPVSSVFAVNHVRDGLRRGTDVGFDAAEG